MSPLSPTKEPIGSLVVLNNVGDFGIYLGMERTKWGWVQPAIFLTSRQIITHASNGNYQVLNLEKRKAFIVSPEKKSFLLIGKSTFTQEWYSMIIEIFGGKIASSFQDPDLNSIIIRNSGADLDKQKRAKKLGIGILTHDDFVTKFF